MFIRVYRLFTPFNAKKANKAKKAKIAKNAKALRPRPLYKIGMISLVVSSQKAADKRFNRQGAEYAKKKEDVKGCQNKIAVEFYPLAFLASYPLAEEPQDKACGAILPLTGQRQAGLPAPTNSFPLGVLCALPSCGGFPPFGDEGCGSKTTVAGAVCFANSAPPCG